MYETQPRFNLKSKSSSSSENEEDFFYTISRFQHIKTHENSVLSGTVMSS